MPNSLLTRRQRAWLIWIVAACFYAYEFFIRVSPAVMVPNLMHSFIVSAAMLGGLSALYYYAYAGMQIPVGILLDRYGIRRFLTIASATVAIGGLLFATAHHLLIAELGRILMGAGSAFSFVGCVKLARNWFQNRQLAVVIGLTNMLGVFGAISAEAPLSMLVTNYGWRTTMLIAGLGGAILALLIRMIVRDSPRALGYKDQTNDDASSSRHTFWQSFLLVLKHRQTWLAAIYGGLMVAPISAFTELWSVPYFVHVEHMSRSSAAAISSVVFIGIAVGGPVIGWLSGYLGHRKPIMALGCVLALASLGSILSFPNRPIWEIATMLFIFGFSTSNMLLVFAINTENNPRRVAGITIGFTNMVVMAGGTIFQPLVGWLIDTFTTGAIEQYTKALWILPACQIAALLILYFIHETYCKEHCHDKGVK